jgi:ribosomal protein S18 acetylase RimI-like enzyme
METITQTASQSSELANIQNPINYRPFRGESDYPHILAAVNASKAADGSERSDTLEMIANTYSHLHNCDPYQDMLFAELADGRVAGYVRVWWEQQTDGAFIGFRVRFIGAEWRESGIGARLLVFSEQRLSQIARDLVREGKLAADTPCYYDAFVAEGDREQNSLLANSGYALIRYAFDMVRPHLDDLPEAPMPAGLVVRTPRPEEYRKVWEASVEAFRDHWGAIEQPEEEYQSWQKDPYFDPTLWRVGWDGDEVAGMVLSFINTGENREYNRLRGYTENICTRRPYRRKGLARSLLVQSLQALKERGMQDAALGVDAESLTGATRLYESVGFRVVRRWHTYRKPFLPAAEPVKE